MGGWQWQPEWNYILGIGKEQFPNRRMTFSPEEGKYVKRRHNQCSLLYYFKSKRIYNFLRIKPHVAFLLITHGSLDV